MNTSPSLPQGVPPLVTPTLTQPAARHTKGRRVTDAPTRAFHALIALSFTGANLTAESEHWRLLHVTMGYALAGLIVLRALYAWVGPRNTQLLPTFKRLAAVPAWARSVWDAVRTLNLQALPWQQTQNLAMAATVAGLLSLAGPLVLTGLGTYNEWDAAWGGEWFSEVHEFFGEFMLSLVFAHIGLIVGLSVLRRTNLARRMVSGRIAGSGPDVVRANRLWLALTLVAGTVAFVAWQGFAPTA